MSDKTSRNNPIMKNCISFDKYQLQDMHLKNKINLFQCEDKINSFNKNVYHCFMTEKIVNIQ